MKNFYQHPESWFIDRIGKTIYRKKLSCPCKDCQRTDIKINDRFHAGYVYLCHNELGIKYFDSMEDVK